MSYPTGTLRRTSRSSYRELGEPESPGSGLRQFREYQVPNKRKARDCEVCGANYRPTYPQQRACGRACGVLMRRESPLSAVCRICGGGFEHATAGGHAPERCPPCATIRPPRSACGICDQEVPSGRSAYCSAECAATAKRAADRALYPPRQLELLAPCERCGRLVHLEIRRWRCDDCLAETKNSRKRRERVRRRTLERSVRREPYTFRQIAERDGWACQICGDPVDRGEVVPHPMAPTIDHIIALANGGHDVPSNVQLAHFACNCGKSNRLVIVGRSAAQ